MCNFRFQRCAYCLNRMYFNTVKKVIKGEVKRFHRGCLIEYEHVSEIVELHRIQQNILNQI